MSNDQPAVLSVAQLAERWQVNEKTVYAEIQEGRIPVLRLGRVIRISVAVVESIEMQGSVVPTGGSHGGAT